MDGFDHYGEGSVGIANALNGAYASFGTFSTITGTNARTGLGSLVCENNSGWRRVFAQARTTFGVGAAFYCPALPGIEGSTVLFNYQDNGAGSQVQFWLDTSGTISARQGTFGNLLLGQTVGPVVPAKAYTHIETKVFCDASAGTVEVRVNGVTVLMATGLDTDPTGAHSIAQVSASVSFSDAGFQIDDLFAWNTAGGEIVDFVGDKKVYTEFTGSDTAQADWVPSVGGSGSALLATNPPNDGVDYVEAGVAGDLSIYGITDLPGTVVSIAAVMTATRMWKTDAGSAHVTVGMISDSANDDGADHSITSAPTYWHDVFETDPATGAPWTLAGFNAAEVFIDRTL
jgi:hypothetical protein